MRTKKYLFLFLMLVVSAAAVAEHEEDHRYTVEGYVLNASEQPLADVDISFHLGNTRLKSATTDRTGFYSVQLHLHDPDWGKTLNINAGGDEATITVDFERGNLHKRRIHKANFVGGKLIESELSGGGIRVSPWVYVGIGVAIFTGLGLLANRIRRNQIRKKRQAQQQNTKKPKQKKRRK